MSDQYTPLPPIPSDLQAMCRRIREKAESYEQYNFTRGRDDLLKAFFDLAQEFNSLHDFYRICVSVPLEMAGLVSALYLCRESDGGLELVCSCERGVLEQPEPAQYPLELRNLAYISDDSYIMPILSKQPQLRQGEEGEQLEQPHKPTSFWSTSTHLPSSGHLLGMYEVRGAADLEDSDRFFLGKYANRIGYNLHNRLIARQNIDRLKFINTLVLDIEHNIIVPNMYFKYLFNQLRKKIYSIEQLGRTVMDFSDEEITLGHCRRHADALQQLQMQLLQDYQEIVKHHAHMSLFIESLFRREHFERGHLVLRPKRCFVEKEVILPQLDHYANRLAAAQVSVDRPQNMAEEELPIMVDIGLLAQVYANFFSNAAKYAREVVTHAGQRRKAMAYGRELMDGFPRPGHKGVKFNVFTTGPSLSAEEGMRLFSEGIRAERDAQTPGTGHGLSFIRHVVEMHGGQVGYEATPEGNNFYFILPLPPVDYPIFSTPASS